MSPHQNSNAKTEAQGKVLTALAESGDAWVKFGTLALVALSGLGNFLATWRSSTVNHAELEKAIVEVHEIHKALDRNALAFRRGTEDASFARQELGEVREKLDRILAAQGKH